MKNGGLDDRLSYANKSIKNVMTKGLKRFTATARTIGNMNIAISAGPFSSIIASILAMAFGVCPRPTPQWPAAITAAS